MNSLKGPLDRAGFRGRSPPSAALTRAQRQLGHRMRPLWRKWTWCCPRSLRSPSAPCRCGPPEHCLPRTGPWIASTAHLRRCCQPLSELSPPKFCLTSAWRSPTPSSLMPGRSSLLPLLCRRSESRRPSQRLPGSDQQTSGTSGPSAGTLRAEAFRPTTAATRSPASAARACQAPCAKWAAKPRLGSGSALAAEAQSLSSDSVGRCRAPAAVSRSRAAIEAPRSASAPRSGWTCPAAHSLPGSRVET
mmetsp:Transcript_15273/g.27201  ORF Transcript_15273/g.27201 Transcript_15273/m.27201 type:complete len:247 (-) Transcript_15273:47-787(-)